jgi:hypothetical protein
MSTVKLDLAAMNAAVKVAFATNVGTALVENEATFPDQPVPGADLIDFAITVGQAADAAQAARATLRELVSTHNDMLATLEGYLRQTGSYVQSVSGGQAAIIELAGLNVRHASGSIGRLPAPQSLMLVPGRNPGTVTLRWQRVKGATTYLIQYAAAATLPSAFNREESVTRSKQRINGLVSGVRYWFRVAAIGAAGPSAWTNVVSVVTQ